MEHEIKEPQEHNPEVQPIATTIPEKKTSFLKLIFISAVIILVLAGGSYAFTQKLHTQKSVDPSSLVSRVTPTMVPEDKIAWNPKVEEIASEKTFDTIQTVLEHSNILDSTEDTNPILVNKHFYNVGTWTAGTYKGLAMIDGVYEIRSKNIAGFGGDLYTSYQGVRFSKKDDKIIIFNFFPNDPNIKNSFPTPTNIIDSTIKFPEFITSTNLSITGSRGEYKGEVPFAAVYQGQTKNFSFDFWSQGNFLATTQPGYRFFTTFYKGQKLYGKVQDKQILWKTLAGDPYYVEELDHTQVQIHIPDQFPNFGDTKGITWITPPDTMLQYKNYVNKWFAKNLKTPADITYATSFSIGCTVIPISDLARDVVFDPSQAQKIGTIDGYTFYLPSNIDSITRNMYDRIKKDTPTIDVSYEQYLKSYPLLVVKDIFGEYQAVFREDYPGRGGGCGKPVIYLYPKEKTHVNVSFASPMQLTAAIPQYHNGWNVIAYPDGTLIDTDNKHYPYLYWEGFTQKTFPELQYGTVVKKDDIQQFLSKTLDAYGLNKQESADFIEYWLPFLSTKPYYVISFYTTKELDTAIPESISPKPDSVLRILMQYHGLEQPISVAQPPTPLPFQRNGFTVVEWGGIYGD